MSMRNQIETLLASGRDSALLRFTLGEICLQDGEPQVAASHLQRAVQLDPDYSAAWKHYGRALAADGRTTAAIAAFDKGIAVADARGDRQAAKEMRVFKKRLGDQAT